MKRATAILATTHVDAHNEAIALSSLEDMIGLIRSAYLPMWENHDPRIAPLGRVIDAELRSLPDGHHAIEAEIELFEPGDEIPITAGDRQVLVNLHDSDRPMIAWDRGFANAEDQQVIGELCELLGADRQEQGKKALEPISILTIAGTVIATNLAGGFLQKAGADAWDVVKPKLKRLFSRRRVGPAQLLCLSATVELSGEPRLIEVIVSDPTDPDIDSLNAIVIEEAIERAVVETAANNYLVRFVFEYSVTNQLALRYAVACNGMPVAF